MRTTAHARVGLVLTLGLFLSVLAVISPAAAAIPATTAPTPGVLLPPPGLQLSIPVSTSGVIADVDVAVRITHTWNEDLRFELTHPNGTRLSLANGKGGDGDGYGAGTNCTTSPTIFNDEAATGLLTSASVFAGSYKPDEPLTIFDGTDSLGDWTFQIADLYNEDFGTVVCVDLRITLSDSTVLTHTIAPAPAAAIPDFVNTVTTRHDVMVSDAGVIADVDIAIRMDHADMTDVDVRLQAPNGATVDLMSDLGAGTQNLGTGAACTGSPTVFDDEATGSITAAIAPRSGSFRPEALLSSLDGLAAAGTWQLVLADDSSQWIGGQLYCVELRFTLNNGSTIVVTTAEDVLDATDGEVSLREAVDMAVADGEPTTIELAENTGYELDRCGVGPANETGQLVLRDDSSLTINGHGSKIQQTCPDQGVIRAGTGSSTVNLNDLSITGGDNVLAQEGGAVTAFSVNLNRVSIFGNTSVGAGAIFAEQVTATNSTISGNTGGTVGGVHTQGLLTLRHTTVVDNAGAAPAAEVAASTINVANSAIGSTAPSATSACEASTSLISGGYNFLSDTSCAFTDPSDIVNGGDPKVGALAGNPPYRRPANDSALLNAVPPASCTAVTVDQVGTSRPNGAQCEIGAYERLAPAAVDDSVSTPYQTAVVIPVFANDSNPDSGHQPALSTASSPAHGTALREGSDYRYTPAAGFTGTDSFTYTICEAAASCDQGVVTVTVAAPGLPGGASQYFPLSPQRLFDTRAEGEPLQPGDYIDVVVTGHAGVPANATAVVMNVTITQAGGPGFVTVWPAGAPQPLASSLNTINEGQTVPNLVTVSIGNGGKVSLFADSGGHLLADVAGYYAPAPGMVTAGRLVPLTPARLFDTRTDSTRTKLGPQSVMDVQVAGHAGVPESGVAAVVMNVTATDASAAGFITVWPSGDPLPVASNLNLTRSGHTSANLVIVPLGEGGRLSFFSEAGAHLLGDVTGYITDSSASSSTSGLMVPLQPARIFDTREAAPLPGNGDVTVPTASRLGVPTSAAAVILNVTAVDASGPGYVTVWPTGIAMPVVSTLNLNQPGETRANAAILPIGQNGSMDYFSEAGGHLLADVFGYYL